MPRPLRSVCVYCSSSTAVDAAHIAVATEVGAELATRGLELVWGGAKVGLMGEVARAARAGGARTFGVIPESLRKIEVADEDADELVVTDTMGARKATMADRADGFLALPGGFGTLEEVLEQITLRLLGVHDKPVVLLDADGFWQPLLDLFEHLYRERFARPESRGAYTVATSAAEALDLLERTPTDLPTKLL